MEPIGINFCVVGAHARTIGTAGNLFGDIRLCDWVKCLFLEAFQSYNFHSSSFVFDPPGVSSAYSALGRGGGGAGQEVPC